MTSTMNAIPALVAAVLTLTPPSGRPPVGPLARVEPRVYDFTFDVTITTVSPYDLSRQRNFHLVDAPIVMPVIFQGTYSTVSSDSLRARLWLGGREDLRLNQRGRLDTGFPFQTQLAVLPIENFTGMSVHWRVGYRVQTWSSRLINEAAAARVPWPREWPAEVLDGLQPQMFIESDHPMFAETVQRVSKGQLRLVPPYLAAKDLVRYCVNEIRVSGNGVNRGSFGVLRGLKVTGAQRTATSGVGGPHDLVCVCVALLRAAGIPARPVIGVEKLRHTKPEFVSWAEFYLPDVGWVPFDPLVMRGKGIRTLDVRRPWSEFGTMKDLNRRIPLAYHFIPPTTVESPQNPAVWGWDPRPGGDPSSEQIIKFTVVSRGRGKGDPR